MTTPLPSYVVTGKVLGRQIVVGVDTAGDVDTAPDAAFPVGAVITFAPSVSMLVFVADHDTIYLNTFSTVVGATGIPKTPDGDDLYLVANIGQTDNDQDWYWQVTVKIGSTRYAPFRFDVAAGNNYLSDQQPIPVSASLAGGGLTLAQVQSSLMGNYATWNSDQTGLVIGGVSVPSAGAKTVSAVVTS